MLNLEYIFLEKYFPCLRRILRIILQSFYPHNTHENITSWCYNLLSQGNIFLLLCIWEVFNPFSSSSRHQDHTLSPSIKLSCFVSSFTCPDLVLNKAIKTMCICVCVCMLRNISDMVHRFTPLNLLLDQKFLYVIKFLKKLRIIFAFI